MSCRAAVLMACFALAADGDVPFHATVIDPRIAGDCKAVGDIDGDGRQDLIVGGMPGERLNWYQAPHWRRTVIATPTTEFTTDCAVADVDGDGDADIVVPDGKGAGNLAWFENPRPAGDPLGPVAWRRHTIGTIGSEGKDVRVHDIDGDGRVDVVTRSHTAVFVFFQDAARTWTRVTLPAGSPGHEGLATGDLDRDGDLDVVVSGAWLDNPGRHAARDGSAWTRHGIGPAPREFKALVADVDGDGRPDVVFSSSEGTADVQWWRSTTGDPRGPWTGRTIVASLERCHTLQAADMDGDGDLDLVLGQMHTSRDRLIMVLHNLDGRGTAWRTQVVDRTGLHNGVVTDVDGDGAPDIFGANWTGHPPVRLWMNRRVERKPAT